MELHCYIKNFYVRSHRLFDILSSYFEYGPVNQTKDFQKTTPNECKLITTSNYYSNFFL